MSFTPTEHPILVSTNPLKVINPDNPTQSSILSNTLLLSGTDTTQLTSTGITYNSTSSTWNDIITSTTSGLEMVLTHGNTASTDIDMSGNDIVNITNTDTVNLNTSYINPTHTGPIVIGNTNSSVSLNASPPLGSTGPFVATCDFVNDTVNSIYSSNGNFIGDNTFSGNNSFTNTTNSFQYVPHSYQLPVDSYDLTNKAYVDTVVGNRSGNGIQFYLNKSQTLNGYGTLSVSVTSATSQTNTNTDFNTTPSQYVYGFITESGFPEITNLPQGVWSIYIYGSATGTNGDLYYQCDLYKYASNGDETLLHSSGYSSDVNSSIPNLYTCQIVIDTVTTLAMTDRLLIKINAISTSVPNSIVLTTYYENPNYSYSISTIGIGQNLLSSNNSWVGTNTFLEPIGVSSMYDSTGATGTSNQILTAGTTGSSTRWISASSIPDWLGASNASSTYLNKAGGTMTGNINMNTHSLTNVVNIEGSAVSVKGTTVSLLPTNTVNGNNAIDISGIPVSYAGGLLAVDLTGLSTYTIPNNLLNEMVVTLTGTIGVIMVSMPANPYVGQKITIETKSAPSNLSISGNGVNFVGQGTTLGTLSGISNNNIILDVMYDGVQWTILLYYDGIAIRTNGVTSSGAGTSAVFQLCTSQTSGTLNMGTSFSRTGNINLGAVTGTPSYTLNIGLTNIGSTIISSATGSTRINSNLQLGTAPSAQTMLGHTTIATGFTNYPNITATGTYYFYACPNTTTTFYTQQTSGTATEITGLPTQTPGVYLCCVVGRFYGSATPNAGAVSLRQVGYSLSTTTTPTAGTFIYGSLNTPLITFVTSNQTNYVESANVSFPVTIVSGTQYFTVVMKSIVSITVTGGAWNFGIDTISLTRIG